LVLVKRIEKELVNLKNKLLDIPKDVTSRETRKIWYQSHGQCPKLDKLIRQLTNQELK
jgi:hypothetical protein